MIKEKNIIKTMYYESPCGILMLGSYDNKLCLCDWQIEKHRNHINRRLKRILNAKFEEGTSDIIEKAIMWVKFHNENGGCNFDNWESSFKHVING